MQEKKDQPGQGDVGQKPFPDDEAGKQGGQGDIGKKGGSGDVGEKPSQPGTEKTHSTSTMFVTIVGTEIPTSEATEGYEAGAAWRRTTSRGRTPFATPVRT